MSSLLVGRGSELRSLSGCIDRARSGQAQVVGVEGPAGIGKSAPVGSVLSDLAEARIVSARQDPAAAGQRGDAVRRLVEDAGWGMLPDGLEPAQAARWLTGHLEDADTLTILGVDDAQWLDEHSREILAHIVRQAPDLPLVVLLAVRTPTPAALDGFVREARQPGRGTWLRLEPLSQAAIAQFLELSLGLVPDSSVVRRVQDVTGGYPLYLGELVRALAGNDDPRVGLSQALVRLKGAGADRVLRDTVSAALAGASSDVIAGHLAVCLGEELTPGQVEDVLDRIGVTAPPLADLLEPGLLVRTARSALRPRHAMLAQAICDRAPGSQLRATHAALGAVLPGTRALEHRVRAARSGQADPELANELFSSAIEHLLAGDGAAGFALTDLAAGLDHAWVPTAALMAMRAQRPDLVLHLDPATPMESGTARAFRALCAAAGQDAEGAFEALASLRPADLAADLLTFPLALAGYAAHEASRLTMATGGHLPAETATAIRAELIVRRDREVAEGMPPEMVAEASNLIGLLGMWAHLANLDARDGEPLLADLAAVREELAGWPQTEPAVAALRSVECEVKFAMSDHAGAFADLTSVSDALITDPDFILQGTWVRSQILFGAGRWDEAQVLQRQALGRTLERHQDVGRQRVLATVTTVPLCRGEQEQVVIHRDQIRREGQGRDLVDAALAQATAWSTFANGGDPTEVARALDDAWSTDRGAVLAGVPAGILRVRALVALGESGRARRAAHVLTDRSMDKHVRGYLEAHCEGILGAQNTPAAALAAYTRGAETINEHIAAQGDCALHLNRAILAEDWATLVLRQGEAAPALLRDELEASHAVIAATGASAWAGRLASLLADCVVERVPALQPSAATGAATRAVTVHAARGHLAVVRPVIDTLTSREREIVWLVADGMSNKEIATMLFLSVRTVEFHISNALRKLGCATRVELRRSVRESLGVRRQA
jgi:DNA-binding CsgD family transcriptional regulator